MNKQAHIKADPQRMEAVLAITQPHIRPILEAVRDHGVGMLMVPQGPVAFHLPRDRAAFLLIGDDMFCSKGPEGFHLPSLRRAIRACWSFVVVAGEPLPKVYRAAASVAVAGDHVMLVETLPEHELQWVSLIQKLAPGRSLLLCTVKGGST